MARSDLFRTGSAIGDRIALAAKPDYLSPVFVYPGVAFRIRFVGDEIVIEVDKKTVRHPWVYVNAPFIQIKVGPELIDIGISDDGKNWLSIHAIIGVYGKGFPSVLLNWRA